MNAKEDRAHNLEIHKMSRMNNDFIQKNVTLEAECKRLQLLIKHESEKHAANSATMLKQFNATLELEREKINALQLHFEKERERLTEQTYKDSVTHRAFQLDALSEIKRHLDTKCNEKINENKIAFDNAMRKLDEDRERFKRHEEEQHAQLNEDREQIKRQLNEARERIKRDEKEQLVQFLFQMESEREKNQCHLEKERALMLEQVHDETIAQRQSNADMLAEAKELLDAKYNEKMNELNIEMQALTDEHERLQKKEEEQLLQLNEKMDWLRQNEEERRVQLNEELERLRQNEEERRVQLNEELEQLKEEREQLKKKEEEQLVQLKEEREHLKKKEEEQLVQLNEELERLRQKEEERLIQLTEEREQIKRDEKEQRVQFLFQMDSEREKLQCHLEKERELMMEQVHDETVAQRQSNADMLAEAKMQLDTKSNAQLTAQLNENTLAFDVAMRQLNEERDQLKQQLDEECKRNMRDDLEREKMHALQLQLENERTRVAEQAQIDAASQRQSNADTLAEMKKQLDAQCNEQMHKNKIEFDAAIQKINEEHARIKQADLEREKIKCQLENERKRVAEQAQIDAASQRQSNADALAEMKQQLDVRWNEQVNKNTIAFDVAMQKLNEEREQIKRILNEERERNKQDDLEREITHALQLQLENERKQLFEQAHKDAVAQRQSNIDAISETKRQLDAQFNAQMNKNKIAFEASMQKLNEERDQLKQHEQALNDLFRKKMQTLQGNFEKEREILAEQARKDDVAQKQCNADALKESKKQFDAQCNEQMNRNKIAFDAAMQKLNEDREKLRGQMELDRIKMQEMHDGLGKEREILAEQARKDDVVQKQCNADALAEMKKQLDSRWNDQLNKNTIAFEASMQKLNEERKQLNQQSDEERKQLKRQSDEERKQLKRQSDEERKQLKQQLDEERKQLKQQLDEARERTKQQLDEARERTIRDELERKKRHVLQLKLEDDLKQVAEELHKYEIATQKLNEEHLKFKSREQKLIEEMKQLKQQLHEEQMKIKSREQKIIEDTHQLKLKMREQKTIEELNEFKTQLHKEHVNLKTREQKTMEELNEFKTQLQEEEVKLKSHEQNIMKEVNTREQNIMEELNELKLQLHEEQLKNKIKCNPELEKQELNTEMSDDPNVDESRSVLLSEVSDAIAANYAHSQLIIQMNFTGKRVVIYSHYSETNEVESYNWLTLECIQHYFDYIIVLTNCPNKWTMHSPNYNKYHFMAYNLKSDFRNYGLFIMQTAKTIVNVAQLCLINDSFVVVDVIAFGRCVKRLFETEYKSCDFLGLTSSHENVFHVQSYFMCFNSITVPAIVAYFKMHGLPSNHYAAISEYELKLTEYLIDKKFASYAVVSNNDMRHPLNTTCCKWSTVLSETGIVKRQHFFKKYAYSAMTDANIASVAEKYAYNKHFMHFLKYHKIIG